MAPNYTQLTMRPPQENNRIYQNEQGRTLIRSEEHIVPIYANLDYTISLELPHNPSEWPFVRIYDKVKALRDAPLIIQRNDITGKTPEKIREFLCLSFTPRFMCDASVPVGGTVTYGILTNKEGQQVRIYLARTHLNLANERPLN